MRPSPIYFGRVFGISISPASRFLRFPLCKFPYRSPKTSPNLRGGSLRRSRIQLSCTIHGRNTCPGVAFHRRISWWRSCRHPIFGHEPRRTVHSALCTLRPLPRHSIRHLHPAPAAPIARARRAQLSGTRTEAFYSTQETRARLISSLASYDWCYMCCRAATYIPQTIDSCWCCWWANYGVVRY